MSRSTNSELHAQFLYDLNSQHKLQGAQSAIARAVFRERKRIVFVQMGRKRGKTETVLYCLVRMACTRPNSQIYWFAPKAKQAREILWESGRLQNFVPKKYVKKITTTDMRVRYYNDSFIKLDGSDEYDQYRGIECDLVGYDEIKDFHPKFDAAFRPNLGPRKAPLLVSGTPPRGMSTPQEEKFFQLQQEAKNTEDGFYVESPSWEREDPDFLAELKRVYSEYERRARAGDEDAINEWNCEYGAKFVLGGPSAIFPMFDRSLHTKPRAEILSEINHVLHDCDFYCIADPGSAACFCFLLIAHDPKRGKAYVLDEIYETNQRESAISILLPQVMGRVSGLYNAPHLWNYIYDEAALWFKVNLSANFEDPGWRPTRKALYRKQSAELKPFIGSIKDALIGFSLTIASECENTIREIENYRKGENGEPPKLNDHAIDILRYFFAESHFEFLGSKEKDEEEDDAPPSRLVRAEEESLIYVPDEEGNDTPELDFLVW